MNLDRFDISFTFRQPVLALGGEQKSRFCLARGREIAVGPDFGDPRSAANLLAYRAGLAAACREEGFVPRIIAHDLHPGYATTLLAKDVASSWSPPAACRAVQHHHAHLASVLADRGLAGPAIGIIWDGTGYGDDGAVWGGEFLVGDPGLYRRAAHLEYVPLPGGEKAVEEPWRMALAYLHHCRKIDFLNRWLSRGNKPGPETVRLLLSMIERGVNSPPTSSMGRLFDGVSALIGTGWKNRSPAEAAINLERAAGGKIGRPYPFRLSRREKPYVIRLLPLFSALLKDIERRDDTAAISSRFHAAVISMGVKVAGVLSAESGIRDVALSGGVFRNRIVREGLTAALAAAGLNPILPRTIDVDDGGLALGQAVAVTAMINCGIGDV
ncbi:MAG: hypothetical protein V1789_06790 [PVC group bacterium]